MPGCWRVSCFFMRRDVTALVGRGGNESDAKREIVALSLPSESKKITGKKEL